MFGFFSKSFDQKVLSEIVLGIVTNLFKEKSGEAFSQDPVVSTKRIVIEETNTEKMHASGFNKVIGRCFLSVIELYKSPQMVKAKKTCGVMILYVRQSYAIEILKALQYIKAEKATENERVTFISKLFTDLAHAFNQSLTQKGYAELTLSETSDFMDKAIGGVNFPYDQNQYQEFRFFLRKQCAFVIDVVLAPLPQK